MSYGSGGSKSNPFQGKLKVSKREVFRSKEIPHKWAHQTQQRARNAHGNLFFEGSTIYSYRHSWPLARIYTNKRSDTLVLTNSERYSVTTAQHQSAVDRAAQHMRCVAVPNVSDLCTYGNLRKDGHDKNIADLILRMENAHAKAKRAITERRVRSYLDDATTAHKDLADYLIFFGIRRKMPALPNFTPLFERVQRIENPDPASLDKRERAKAQRKQAEYAKERLAAIDRELSNEHGIEAMRLAARRNAWRLDCMEWDASRHYLGEPVMLRLTEEYPGTYQSAAIIETSMGASIPADHAPMLWRAVQRVIASKVPYEHNGHSLHAGDYRIDAIETDGTLRAGCHTIEHSELRAMARQLGLT